MELKTKINDLESSLLATYSRKKWEKIKTGKRSGVLVPLFSVYSQDSIGIGDLVDLRSLIDWCQISGNSILQLLPMNEMGMSFCPYDSTSSFALEPLYLNLNRLPGAGKKALKSRISELKNSFPVGKLYVDYRLKAEKLKVLWDIFDKAEDDSPAFKKFIRENSYWLDDFALFNTLKFLEQGKAWFDWEEKYRDRDPSALQTLLGEQERTVLFHKWLQWQLYQQFKEVRDYAKEKNILLKGDLPILVSRDSADAWAHPEYFKLDFVAGAPPDMYCAKGQRWGTPTYNWEKIFSDGGVYLEEKLKYAENFYDILRIDHVVGLFRIWSIPYHDPEENMGLHGTFDPKDEHLWEAHGRKILSFMLNNTGILLCAEDLGVIPKSCPKALKELGIPGNEVQRWTKEWDSRHDFLQPEEYREFAVAMLSTHDTTNWPAWWENEAGTVDEKLFVRKCLERGIDFSLAKEKFFHPELSRHGRLRWLDEIDSVDLLVHNLGKSHGELRDFIDLYKNSYHEKEKLWKLLGLSGEMREACDKETVKAILQYVLGSASVFVINLITDWLYLGDNFKDDAYIYRYNTPGTVNDRNWSLVLPVSLEKLLEADNNSEILSMIKEAGR
ncbi:MAG: 4-alpha-glucanotransferase [Candidatus Omnitrophica bacterium]|nr:4-alpha-glucanotransferase [Candidatus Omnitrophota bacterium]